MTSSIQIVLKQFPFLHERVAGLFDRDHVFRELCEDYETCLVALSRAESSDAESSAALRLEYSALRLRLETELLRYVQEAEKQGLK